MNVKFTCVHIYDTFSHILRSWTNFEYINLNTLVPIFAFMIMFSVFCLDDSTVTDKHCCIPLRSATIFHSRNLLGKSFCMLVANCPHIGWEKVNVRVKEMKLLLHVKISLVEYNLFLFHFHDYKMAFILH